MRRNNSCVEIHGRHSACLSHNVRPAAWRGSLSDPAWEQGAAVIDSEPMASSVRILRGGSSSVDAREVVKRVSLILDLDNVPFGLNSFLCCSGKKCGLYQVRNAVARSCARCTGSIATG